MADSTGMADLRAENVERAVKGFALQEYRFKQLLMVNNSNSWQESYFQETAADLEAGLTRNVKGIPRLAKFPYGEVTFTKKPSYLAKYGMEGVISWEDERTNNVDVIARTLLRIARAVTKSVDAEIWDVLSESQSPSLINTLAIAAGSEWNSATLANRDPIQNILDSKAEIEIDNYDPDNGRGFLLLGTTDFANLLGNANVRNAGQFYTDDVTRNGVVGRMLGLTIIKSNNVTADFAMVGIAKECGTWKAAQPLTVVTIDDPGIKTTIRAWEVGQIQVVNPDAICKITGV